MRDRLLQGGRVVAPAGVGNRDVGIMGEQIVAGAFPGILPGEAKHIVVLSKYCGPTNTAAHPFEYQWGWYKRYRAEHYIEITTDDLVLLAERRFLYIYHGGGHSPDVEVPQKRAVLRRALSIGLQPAAQEAVSAV